MEREKLGDELQAVADRVHGTVEAGLIRSLAVVLYQGDPDAIIRTANFMVREINRPEYQHEIYVDSEYPVPRATLHRWIREGGE